MATASATSTATRNPRPQAVSITLCRPTRNAVAKVTAASSRTPPKAAKLAQPNVVQEKAVICAVGSRGHNRAGISCLDIRSISCLRIGCGWPGGSGEGQDFGPDVGDQDRVFELGAASAVFGDDGPAVGPEVVVNGAKRQHRLDSEGH